MIRPYGIAGLRRSRVRASTRRRVVRASAWLLFGAVATVARWRWARQLRRSVTGARPGVRCDDGVLLHIETDGSSSSGLTVVLAHGFAARLGTYDPQRQRLRDHARVVLFDQRGHGRSGWGSRRSATVDRLGRDLGDVLDATTGNEPVVVVGHSLGGMALMALARQRPELFGRTILGVALLSTSAGDLAEGLLPDPVGRIVRRSRIVGPLLRAVWVMAPVVDRLGPLRTALGRWLLRRWLFAGDDAPARAVSDMQKTYIDTPYSVAATFLPAIVTHDEQAGLRAIARVPTLVLAGSSDKVIPPSHSERIAEAVGSAARLVVIPGAGHMVPLTRADEVNRALVHLLQRVRAAAREDCAMRGADR